MRYLTVPGYTNSGPDHWQTHLENTYAGFDRVVQDDWDAPDRHRWVARLDETVRGIEDEVLLVGHSCGSVTAALWAATCWDSRVTGAVLVAPGDVEAEDALPEITRLAPLPRKQLPLKTHLVITDNDPYLSLERGRSLARTWGSSIEVLPGGGHLATADGFGEREGIASIIEQVSGRTLDRRTRSDSR